MPAKCRQSGECLKCDAVYSSYTIRTSLTVYTTPPPSLDSRKEYNAFLRACEVHGRLSLAAITAEVNGSARAAQDPAIPQSSDQPADPNPYGADGATSAPAPAAAASSSGAGGVSGGGGGGAGRQQHPPKTEAEVAAYAETFFRRYREIKDGDKIFRRIEANEQRRRWGLRHHSRP